MTFAANGTYPDQTEFTGAGTLSLNNTAIGGLIPLIAISVDSSANYVTGISGGGANWTQIGSPYKVTTNGGVGWVTKWLGVVTATGSQTATVSVTGGGPTIAIFNQEFSSSAGIYVVDVHGVLDASGSGQAGWTSLTPTGSHELYFGAAIDSGIAVAGSTSGYVYHVTSHQDSCAWNLDVSAASAPTWGDSHQLFGGMMLIREIDSGTAAVTMKKMTVAVTGSLKDSGTAAVTLKKMSLKASWLIQPYVAYAFDEGSGSTITDYSGNSHHMTVSGTNSWASGHGSYSSAFQPGTSGSDGATYAPGSPIPELTGDITIMMWYKHTAGTSTTNCHAGGAYSGSGTARNALWSYRNLLSVGASPEYTVRDNSGSLFSEGVNGTTADNSWHHSAIVYHSTGEMEIYLDGTRVVDNTPTSNPIGSLVFQLGVGSIVSGAAAQCVVQDMRVFDSALTSTDINTYKNTAVHITSVSGTAAVTLNKTSVAITGKLTDSGTAAVTLKKTSVAITGKLTDSGTSAGTLKKLSVVVSGKLVDSAATSVTLKKVTVAGTLSDNSATVSLFGDPDIDSNTALVSDSGSYTLGMLFTVDRASPLTGIKFYSIAGASSLPVGTAIFNMDTLTIVSGTQNDSPSWSGAAGSGWVKNGYDGSVILVPGTHYAAAVMKDTSSQVYSSYPHYWGGSGPGTNGRIRGPLTAPSSSSASIDIGIGQDAFHTGGGWHYPADSFNDTNYWVDVEVRTTSFVSVTSAIKLKKMTASVSGKLTDSGTVSVTLKKATTSASAKLIDSGTASATLRKITVSASGIAFYSIVADVSLKKMSVNGSGKVTMSGSITVNLQKMQVFTPNEGPSGASSLFVFSQL